MLLDAIVLAGGRSSRLAGVPKSELVWRGETLLQRTVGAALDAGARRVVVVGPGLGSRFGSLVGLVSRVGSAAILEAREDPPFGGPVAAVAAGLDALDAHPVPAGQGDGRAGNQPGGADPGVLVLACDMPRIAGAVELLVGAWSGALRDGLHDERATVGVLMLDAGARRQPLAAVYALAPLADSVAGLRASGALEGASMRSLIAPLQLLEVADPDRFTRDVDTENDAAAFDIRVPATATSEPREDRS